jgi:gas vesicle protein
MMRSLKNLIVGAVGGAILGVLFAPKKGADLRKEIQKDPVNAVKGAAKTMGDDISCTAKAVSNDEKVKKGVKKTKELANKAKDKAEKLYNENVPKDKRKKISNTIDKTVDKAKSLAKKLKKSK